MASLTLFCAFFVFNSCGVTACSSPVFVEKGKDVLLNATEMIFTQDEAVVWKFNKTVVLVTFFPDRIIVSPDYAERIEVHGNKYSIKLNNLQHADSGFYTARATGAEKEHVVAGYNVSVQDPVSPAQLMVDFLSSSSDSCELNVTCSTPDSHISSTFRCDAQTCSQEGGERSEVTTSCASLHVYLENDSVICEHRNKVSRIKNMTDIQHLCFRHADPNKQDKNLSIRVVPSIICPICIIIGLAAICY